MDNTYQSNHNNPLTSNPGEPRTSNMYFLQVKPNNLEGSIEAEAIPLHMLINEQDVENEQYLISVLQAKQLQLIIDPRGQLSTNVSSQYYEIPTPELQGNAEFTSNNLNSLVANQPQSLTEHEHERTLETSLTETVSNSSNQEVVKNNDQGSHGRQIKVVQKFVHILDRVAPPRAVAVLPAVLQIRREVVSPRRPLPARVRFGPLEGVSRTLSCAEAEGLVLEFTSSGLPVFLLKDDQTVTHIDVSDKDKSNWLSLLPLGDQSTANVWLCQEDNALYAVTTQPIASRTPLVLGYSKEYVDNHRLPVEQPVLDLDTELASKHRQWPCYECQRSMSSAALLQRHIDVHHLEEKQRSQQRYRCRHCTRTFCRMFTLRRHMARHCTKKEKEEKVKNPESVPILECSKPEELPELSLNTSNPEDSRLPSDESLQTLTNNLDFSTNLFDTDRMPSLDISGSSRSDNDFNPYSLSFKDDIGLASSVEFPIESDPCNGKKEVKTEAVKTVFLNCRYCKQTVVKGRQRQHVRACPGRKFQCECGRAFLYKDKLALHIHVDHASESPIADKQSDTKESDGLQYRCETCKHTFKRRGMLVNHLWRVHKNVSTAVPLERRVRIYPCVACPKVYRTAAKRDRHVRTHHPGKRPKKIKMAPGSELLDAPALEGGRRACEPAACSACPRQYATRAKLLQHVRAHHPHLAPPVKKKLIKR